jgi:dienelactone hydrolase
MRPHFFATFLRGALAALLVLGAALRAQPVIQTVFYDMPAELLPNPIPAPTAQLLAVPGYPNDAARLTFIARLYRPDPAVHGPGPYPVVLFLHGAGGFWPSDSIPAQITADNAPIQQLRDWGNLLVGLGYAALFPDSFNPRGIGGNFDSRRPHHDPLLDDAACSPNYERPKDVVAALAYLASRTDIDRERVALIGFSHGAQTGMNALLDVSVDRGTYDVDYIARVEQPAGSGNFVDVQEKRVVPGPVRIPAHLPFPKFCAFYYGGGGHYSYHGSPSSTAAGRYMLDRRTTAILFHGTGDPLMGISNINTTPITATATPLRQVLASAAQAATLGLPNPIVRHYLFDRTAVHAADTRVGHSFDLGTVNIAAPADWDTAAESPNQKARRLARDEVLRWLDFTFGPRPALALSVPTPGTLQAAWPTRARLAYRLETSTDLLAPWTEASPWTTGDGALATASAALAAPGRRFYRLHYRPAAMPVSAPEHAGFFKTYADFGL